MGAEMTIVGGGVVAFLFIYLMSKLDNKHFIFKTLLIFFSAISIMLVGQGVVGEQYNCSWLVTNSTTVGATNTYSYDYFCDSEANVSNQSFYTLTLWFFRILLVYSIIYFLYAGYQYVIKKQIEKDSWKRGKT